MGRQSEQAELSALAAMALRARGGPLDGVRRLHSGRSIDPSGQWENDDRHAHDTTLRVQDNPKLATVFSELVGHNPQLLDRLPDQLLR